MPLVMDSPGNLNAIRSYAAGEVRVGETVFRRCCVIAPQALLADWPPNSLDDIRAEHLPALFALEPEVVLLGSSGAQRFAPAALRRAFAAKNIGLESMEFGAACRTYNVLAQDGRHVVAVLFPG